MNKSKIHRNEITSSDPGPHVLLIAGVHGDEYEPMIAAIELVSELGDKILKGKITIVSVVNRSAYSIGSRFGQDHLNLARVCPGNAEGSITERYANQISQLIREADYLIDMHTGGGALRLFPLVGYALNCSDNILEKQREMALSFNLPLIFATRPGEGIRGTGRTLSVALDAQVPAIYLEYEGGSGFRKEAVKAYKDGFLNFLKTLGMISGNPETIAEEERYWLEDKRPGSGYFDGKMGSPADGIFISEVEVGEIVNKGSRFGKIIDPYNGKEDVVYVETDGLVVSLLVAVRVYEGAPLGHVIPISKKGRVTKEFNVE